MEKQNLELNDGKVLSPFEIALIERNLQKGIDFKERKMNPAVMDEVFFSLVICRN